MTVFCFLKFFQEEQHAREFAAGRLHLNPLAYFKGLEDHDDGRADRHEAPLAWHQPSKLGLIEVAGVPIDPGDLAGPIVIQGTDANVRNVLCLYAVTSGPFETITSENVDAFREHLRVPDRCRSMGPFVVMVRQPQVFIGRFVEAAKRSRFAMQCGLVTYFDPDSFSGGIEHPPFMKKRVFAWQREYRFTLDRGVTVAEPYTFDIGSLADLCTMVDPARLTEPAAFRPA
jgi:hypothetical protein